MRRQVRTAKLAKQGVWAATTRFPRRTILTPFFWSSLRSSPHPPQATLKLKMDREEEKMEALEFNRQKAALKKDLLNARSQMGMDFIRHRAQHAEQEKQNKRNKAVREGQFKSRRDR